jgi:capsid assembly protease
VSGVISKYADMINGLSQPQGITSAELAATIRRAGNDRKATGGVLLDIDSPGGTVAGISDVAAAVNEIKDSGREIVGFAHDLAASAAYWLASQCSAVYLTPTAEVGSIGVYAVVEDSSEYYAERGIKRFLVASGPHKGGGAPGTMITPDHIQSLGESVMAHARVFRAAVAAGRGMSDEDVEAVATGRTFVGDEAVTVGLADGVMGFDRIVEAMNDKDRER